MIAELRIENDTAPNWRDIEPERREVETWEDADAQAQALANSLQRVVRWNREGSGQGHYMQPEETKPC